MSSPPSNVSTNKQLFKKTKRPQKLGEVKAKNMTNEQAIRYCSKRFPEKNGPTDFEQRVFSHSQCMVVSKKEIKIGGHC